MYQKLDLVTKQRSDEFWVSQLPRLTPSNINDTWVNEKRHTAQNHNQMVHEALSICVESNLGASQLESSRIGQCSQFLVEKIVEHTLKTSNNAFVPHSGNYILNIKGSK